MSTQGVRRAAVVIEMDDGERMLYEFNPEQPIVLEMSLPDYAYEFTLWELRAPHRNVPRNLAIAGEFLGGVHWAGDMPTAMPDRPEIEVPVREIEKGDSGE